jgi:PAS domain S-box-containing protein/putative nucleotidyltransferase with HDIG domain
LNKKILLVEDEKTTSVLIQKYIRDSGYSLTAAVEKGEEAFNSIRTEEPHLILMDITLEGEMDGIESAEKINSIHDIPIIFITSSADQATIERAIISNPYGYIIKPIDKKELKAAIEMAFLRYEMDKKLKENEQKFSTILNSIADGVIVADSQGKVNYMNPVAEEITKYSLNEKTGHNINELINIENTALEHMREADSSNPASEAGYNFLITKDEEKIPIDYSVAPQKNEKGKFIGTVMVIKDVSERVKYEQKVHESLDQLRKAMGGMIQAIAYTIETRDPYTAGHQRRVADLAREIAQAIGLESNKIEGIRMAGVIHDLGKISVPAEILSKPGKLTEIEFNLIKIHPQIGYEILNPIEFPWPVADIIYQHHEKINGSGYPRGLGGDEIMVEAKILTVADVVEAMASHRPYRAAKGIDSALAEIDKNKGILYDKDIAETCIDLFKTRGYVMNYS